MSNARRYRNQDQHTQSASRSPQVQPPTSTIAANDNMTIEQASFGAGQVQENAARPRIINRGHLKIYSDYNAYVEIVNLPGSTMELSGASSRSTQLTSEHWQNPAAYTPNIPTYSVNTAPVAEPVARFYCLSCKAKYFTQERLDQHIKEYPRFCVRCKACRKKDGKNYCCLNSRGFEIPWVPGRGGAVKNG